MTTYAFSIDLDHCIGCQACTLACKAGNERPIGGNYIEVRDVVRGTFPNLVGSFIHHRCLHCASAACVSVCPTGALSKRNGLTAVEPDKCSGCGYCTDACPFGVPQLVDNRVSKCSGCFDRVEANEVPWCVQTCPSQAIKVGLREKVLADAQLRVEALKLTHPNAQVYDQPSLGGLGALFVLLDRPAVYDLPEKVELPLSTEVWQQVVQPASAGLLGLGAITLGLGFIFARRTHNREKAAELAQRIVQEEAMKPGKAKVATAQAPASSGETSELVARDRELPRAESANEQMEMNPDGD